MNTSMKITFKWMEEFSDSGDELSFEISESITLAFIKHCARLAELFDGKQHDYGSQNIAKFGEEGVLVRVSDKVEQLINLSKKVRSLTPDPNAGSSPVNESIEDFWMDIAVYGIIALMVRNGEWPNASE